MVKLLKDAGITEIRGLPVEERIVVDGNGLAATEKKVLAKMREEAEAAAEKKVKVGA